MDTELNAIARALQPSLRLQANELSARINARLHQDDMNATTLSNCFGLADDVQANVQNERDLALLRQDVQELDAVAQALHRMAQGTYGLCLHCGGAIPAARLHAQPLADLCLACQMESERNFRIAQNRR